MKKNLNLLTILLMLTIFTNCTEENDFLSENQKNDFNKIIELKSDEQQKIAFKMLSSKEKLNIWKMKYNIIKDNNYVFFDEKPLENKQKIVLDELFNSLNEEYFENKNSKKSLNYYKEYLPQMKEKALKVFTKEELKIVFSSLKIEYSSRVQQLPGISCGCNTSDDWCTGSSTCTLPCTETSTWGCGWWGAEACNGSCGTIS